MAAIRTVLGDIAPDALGVCDAHDHLFFRTPVLPGQELDDPVRALGELRAFAALGGQAVVQWTPWGLGGRREELPALSRSSGVHIVSATGLHQARHYEDIPDDLTGLFVAELASGAGMIKVAGAYHHLDDHARRVMTAAAEAHHATDAPIGVHLEGGTAALDTLDLLCGREGVPPNRVILGHMHRFPDTRIHRQVAEAGAFVAFDGPSRVNHATDWRLLDSLAALADAGHADSILVGGDTVVASARSDADGPGMPYLLNTLRPRIEREIKPDLATSIFVRNPARAFAAEWKVPLG
jgi:phosphotriesterase-related protein